MTLLTPADALGSVGLILLLSAFAANVAGRLDADTVLYEVLNLLGSSILGVYSVLIEAWVFLPLEVAWAGVAAWSLGKRVRRG